MNDSNRGKMILNDGHHGHRNQQNEADVGFDPGDLPKV